MGVIYAALIIILINYELDWWSDTFMTTLAIGLIGIIFTTLFFISPHYSYNTEIVNTATYSLVPLSEINNKRYDNNTYIIYDSFDDEFIYYYKGNNGVIYQNSIPASSDFVTIVKKDNIAKQEKNKRDYTSTITKHLFCNSFAKEYILTIPEDSEIYQLFPAFVE